MKYPVSQLLNYTVIHLTGEIDLSESPEVRKQILACINKKNNLLVDLSGVGYIDSSGVASLVEGLQLSRTKEMKFALLGVSESALKVLQLARLDCVFKIYKSPEDIS
ncbi:MAG TPA: anti-sigma factor antagonist [Gammaproteobacteria bacterium]|nr:anti-sigma factor antagonist [Gammaproteobacteria bacterium]